MTTTEPPERDEQQHAPEEDQPHDTESVLDREDGDNLITPDEVKDEQPDG